MGPVLPGPQITALAALANTAIAERFYLAGGTALALQLSHRESYDLDFFREEPFDPEAELRSVLSPEWTVTRIEPNTAHATFRRVRVSLLGFPYPLLRPLVQAPAPLSPRVKLASIEDIVAMKLSAIGSRGARRDFIDLYCAMRNKALDLSDVLKLFETKFRQARYDPYHFARALAYFADAEHEPMPRMLWKDVRWEEVRRHLESQSRSLVIPE